MSTTCEHRWTALRAMIPGTCLLALLISAVAVVPSTSRAATVNWLDPLDYPKPRPIAVPMPNEESVPNKYWVDLSSGTGSSCTRSNPCQLSAVSGKPGTTGGPAYIYIRGKGPIGSPTLYGSPGNEVVIKPWDDNTMATITGRNNWTTRHQHVIWDGGPNLMIRFENSGSGQFDPSVYFNARPGLHSNITFYRTQWEVTNGGEWVAQWGVYDNLSFINSEFYATRAQVTNAQHHMYMSGASNYGPSTNLNILGNIFRDTPGEAIEIRLFQNLDGLVIDGNAMHNIGKGTCRADWKCRSAITFDASGGGSLSNARITNNLIWDTGEGIIRLWSGNPLIANNTFFDWGKGEPANGGWGQWALFGYSNNGRATIRNNIIYATGSTANGYKKIPFDRSNFDASNNLCASGTSCGSASRTVSEASFLSLNPSSNTFLVPSSSSEANSGGTSVGLSVDYLGSIRRESSGSIGIGAITGGDIVAPNPPTLDVK